MADHRRPTGSATGRPTRLARLTGLATVALLVATGCGAASSVGMPPRGGQLAALSSMIAATNNTRAALLKDVSGEDTAVRTADAADQAALAGAREEAAPLIPVADGAVLAAVAAAARTRADVTAYANAVAGLAAVTASAPISAAQRRAIGAVVAAGRNEAAALRASVASYAVALPTYQQVVAVQLLWYDHANAGWFSTPTLAGGAYQVALTPFETALSADRQAIATANAARPAATDAMNAALTAARTALASLS